jgi:hypothetical protein
MNPHFLRAADVKYTEHYPSREALWDTPGSGRRAEVGKAYVN